MKHNSIAILFALATLTAAPFVAAQTDPATAPPPSAGSTTGESPGAVALAPSTPPDTTTAPPPLAPAAPVDQPATAPTQSSKVVDHVEVGGLLGDGVQLDSQATHPFGVTLGARAGVVLPTHLYLGAAVVVFAGQSQSFQYGGYEYTGSLWQTQLGLEGGYDFILGPVTLRPYGGIGLNHTISSVTAQDVFGNSLTYDAGNSTAAYLSAGGMVHVDLTDRVYAGLDTRLTFVTESPSRSALVLAASGGVKF